MATSQEILNEGAKAKELMVASIRDLLNMKVTLPLGNPALKQVHTNQFCWIELPPEFELANFKEIAKAMDNTEVRYSASTYDKNRWYIEGVTITCDGDTFDMQLDLNPFASSLTKYRDERLKWMKAYTDANTKTTTTTANNNNSGVASTGGKNTTLKGGQGTVIDNAVKRIVGNETRPYYKATAIHRWLQQNVRYKYYECTRYNTPEKCYNHRRALNCADTARLTCAMMRSAGLTAYVVHRTFSGGHFWTVIEINGKKFASDQTGDGSPWNTVWVKGGRRGGGGSAPYSRKNGANPDC